jgi:ribonuclease BN (tRNA processing enzyme)
MKVILGGVRGTSCIARPDFLTFGGDTTSVLVEGDAGDRILIDAGTGIRALGQRLEGQDGAPAPLLLFTHYHLDHLIGLPSLSLLYRSESRILIASPVRGGRSAQDVLPPFMAQPYWPVQMSELHASIEFMNWTEEASREAYRFGGLEVRWCPVHHPGGCTAYRIDEPRTGRSVVMATDIEWNLSTPEERQAFFHLCAQPAPASLLLFDGQFSRQNYGQFTGWGHSAWEDAVDAAREVKAKLLLVIHHAPQGTDAELAALERDVVAAMPNAHLGRCGMEVVL